MSGEHGTTPENAISAPACLSFAQFNQRIDALPDGPVGVLNAPRWQRVLDRLGLLPLLCFSLLWVSLKLEWLAPALWMVPVARYLVMVMALLWLPGFVRSVWVLGHDLCKGTAGFMQQWDHDLALFESLQDWLAQHPREHLEQRLLQCRQLQENLQRKLGLFLGVSDRFGVLPVLVAVFYLLQQRQQLLALPGWIIALGVFIVLVWFIALSASRVRLRLAVMADLLEGTLRRHEHP